MKSSFSIILRRIATTVCLSLFASHAAVAGDQVSPAETMLFETNHLREIQQPVALQYDFLKAGSMEPGYRDSVEIDIRAIEPDGTKSVSTRYLSGANQRNFPPVEHARGNPVLMYFLERDIREMQRLTGGNWRYFKKRIQLALADKAQVRAVNFRHGNEQLSGREIRITPYADDPQKARYEKLAGKYYVFVLSDAIPGKVYQMRAVVPDDKAGQARDALLDETLTFARANRD